LFQPRKDNKKVIWEGLLILLVAADLLAAHWNFNPITDKSLFMLDAGESESMCRRIYMSESNEYVVKYGWFFNFKTFFATDNWQSLIKDYLANTNLFSHTYLVNNFDPLVPESFSTLMGIFGYSGRKYFA